MNGFESEFFEIEIRIEPVTPSCDNALTNVSITIDWSGINNGSDDVFCSTLNMRVRFSVITNFLFTYKVANYKEKIIYIDL